MPKIVDAAEQRAHIRRAALTTFARRGLTGTGLAHVAAEAGISRASLYHYYADKAALISDVARELLVEEERLFANATNFAGPADERIQHLARAVVARFDTWARLGRPLLEIWAKDTRRLKPLLRRLREKLADLIRDGQQRGEIDSCVEPEAAAALIVGMIDGLLLQVFVDPTGLASDQSMQDTFALALNRLLRPAAAERHNQRLTQ